MHLKAMSQILKYKTFAESEIWPTKREQYVRNLPLANFVKAVEISLLRYSIK